MAVTWFYMKDNKRVGPVSPEQLRQLAADGWLAREDSVWTVGMNQWAQAGDVPGLFHAAAAEPEPAPAVTAPAPAPAPAPVVTRAPATLNNERIAAAIACDAPAAHAPQTMSYYDGGLPPRAANNLRGHAPPTGDRYDWPLDDARVEQFAAARRSRALPTCTGCCCCSRSSDW